MGKLKCRVKRPYAEAFLVSKDNIKEAWAFVSDFPSYILAAPGRYIVKAPGRFPMSMDKEVFESQYEIVEASECSEIDRLKKMESLATLLLLGAKAALEEACVDEPETYTNGYRIGLAQGRVDALKCVLQIPDDEGRYGEPEAQQGREGEMARKPQFTWDSWDFDLDGDSFIIAKRECLEANDVPDYIIKQDQLHPDCRADMVVQEGWCCYQIRSDWYDMEGEPLGGYHVEKRATRPTRLNGKPLPGWFPVWIVRKGEWY